MLGDDIHYQGLPQILISEENNVMKERKWEYI